MERKNLHHNAIIYNHVFFNQMLVFFFENKESDDMEYITTSTLAYQLPDINPMILKKLMIIDLSA